VAQHWWNEWLILAGSLALVLFLALLFFFLLAQKEK
jgi:hypothetical protein